MKWLMLSLLTITLYMSDGTQQIFTGNYELYKTPNIQETYTESVATKKETGPFKTSGKSWGSSVIQVIDESEYYIVSKDGYAEFISPTNLIASVDIS